MNRMHIISIAPTVLLTIMAGLLTTLLVPFSATADTVVELTVNGGATASVNNGEPVLLEWYINGAVSNCSINNGVGAVDMSILPAQGSREVVPPDNGSTNYRLTCTGGSSDVTVYINPEITLTSWPENTVDYDPLTGTASFELEWESRYATECTKVWWTTASDSATQRWTTDANNPDRGDTSGVVEFGSGKQGPITETSTFSILCRNVVTGSESVETLTITVDGSVPPPSPKVEVWVTGGETVLPDPVLGWAYVEEISYATEGVTSCTREAYYLDGTPYDSLPYGYDEIGWTWAGVVNFPSVRIIESTRFEVTCTQPAYTFNGVNYPASQVSDSVIVYVNPPVSLDRSGVPPIMLTLTPTATTFETNPLTNYALAQVQVTVENAEACDYSASDHADGWWGQDRSGTKDAIEFANLYADDAPVTYTLYATCYREFDLQNFPPGSPEYEAAEVEASVEITVIPSTADVPPLQTFVYGNATWYDLWELKDIETNIAGFELNSGAEGGYLGGSYPAYISPTSAGHVTSPVNTNGTITFPFNAFYEGTGDNYDIVVAYCDENDGFNDFTLTTESGFTTTWRSDEQTHDGWCNRDNTTRVKRVGVNVPLTDGELVTISCNNSADSLKLEQCALFGVGFGQGDGDTITAVRDINSGFAPVSILWVGEHADWCTDAEAVTESGIDYNFSSAQDRFVHTTSDISETTTFSVACKRQHDGLEFDISDVTISLDEVIIVDALVQTGECIDEDTGLLRQAQVGERAGAGGVCEPGVDLRPLSPAMSFDAAVVDSVSGVYDSIDALMVIQNLGPHALPAGANVPLQAQLNLNDAVAAAFEVADIQDSTYTPLFSDAIAAPTMVAGVATPPTESPTITRTFDGVPFGTHELCARINLDDDGNHVYGEWNIVTTNNQVCVPVTLPVPPPPLTLTANRDAVRARQPVTISWSLNVTYDMSCTVRGPGGLNQTFTTSNPDTNPYSGSFTTQELTSTSRFVIECVEPLTNTTFTEEVIVDFIPRPFEV